MPDWSHWLDLVLPFLRSPLGAVVFIPVYALWVTLLLPGIWASMPVSYTHLRAHET